MAGPMYLVKILNGSETVIQNPPTILRCGRQIPAPILKFASITEQGGVKNVSLGNYACSVDGTAIDVITTQYVNYNNLTPDSSTFRDLNGYNLTDLANNLFCVEQSIKIGEAQLQYGSTFYIDYEKIDIKGFIDDNDSPNYVLKDSVTLSFGSGSTAGTIDFEVSNGRIKILTDAFPKVPQEQDPVTLKFICALDLSEEDFETAFAQNMDPTQEFAGYGYVFYDSVLVQDGFTVTFDSQGGSAVSPITGVESGSTIEEPEPPTKEHYNFGGWFKESDCINEWDFDTDTVTEDITLYAKFTIETFTVTFNSEGGTQVSPYTSVEYGSTISEPSTPEKLEKDFGGWFKDEEYENEWDFENDVVTDDITLYAKWIDWSTSRISNPNVFSGMPLTLTRGRKVRREFRPFR